MPESPSCGRSDGSDRSVGSVGSRLRPSGGYRHLRSFQTSTIIYDTTVRFCDRFLDRRSRTVDQMVQAARSGRQNIAEGSRAAAASSQTELRLVNVARASLDELLLDYEDFIRQRRLRRWGKDDPETRRIRALGAASQGAPRAADYAHWLEHDDPAIVANALLCLIHQTNYLLDRQIQALERSFIQDGGYTEKLAAARIARRKSGSAPVRACPECGNPMQIRTAKAGPHPGSRFWGCSRFPDCRATARIDPSDGSDRSDRSVGSAGL